MAKWTGPWNPALPPPRGNTFAVRHGARSKRIVGPRAEAILEYVRSTPTWPSYLNDPSYAPALASWAETEARVELLREYIWELGFEMMDETSEEESEEADDGVGNKRKVSKSKRRDAALKFLNAEERLLQKIAHDLGLYPISRARIARDLAITSEKMDLAQLWADEDRRNGVQVEDTELLPRKKEKPIPKRSRWMYEPGGPKYVPPEDGDGDEDRDDGDDGDVAEAEEVTAEEVPEQGS